MKKKSLLLLMFSIFALTAWCALPSTGATGYLYNEATGKFLAHGVTANSNVGALVDDYGIPVEITNEGAASEFSGHTYLRLRMCDYYSHYLKINTSLLDCSGSGYHKWAAQEVTGGFVLRCIYKSSQVAYANQGAYVSIASDGSLVLAEGLDNAAVWQWKSAAEQKALVAEADNARLASAAAQAGLTATTVAELETALDEYKAIDMTSSIANPTLYSDLTGWTVNNIQGTAINNGSYQIQNAAGTQATCSQTVTGLEPGLYKVRLQAFYRATVLDRCVTMGQAGYYFTNAYLRANDSKMQLVDWYTIANEAKTQPTSRGQISSDFNESEKYTNTLYAYVGEDGKLDIEIAVPSYSAGSYPNWICFNNVRLTYYEAPAVEPEPSTLEAGTYYLYNVGADLWFNYGGDDDYTAVLKQHGEPVQLAGADGRFTIQTALDSRYVSSTATSANAHSSSATSFIFTAQSDGSYTISSTAGLMGFGGTVATKLSQTKVVMNLTDADDANTHWQLLTRDQLLTRLASATASNPVDATFLLTAPNFDRHHSGLTAWTNLFTGWNTGYLCNNAGYKFDSADDVSQSLTGVPNGVYLVRAQGFYREGSNGVATGYTEASMPLHGIMYANNDEVLVGSILAAANRSATDIYGSYGRSYSGGYIPYGAANNYAGACIAFDNGLYAGNEVQTTVLDGALTIGFKISSLTQYSWLAYDNVELFYLGMPEDLGVYEEALAKAVSEANALVLPTKQKGILDTVVAENNKKYSSVEAYQNAIAAINEAKSNAEVFVAPYEQYKTFKQMIQEKFIDQTTVYTDPDNAADTYTTSISTADANVENAETTLAITTETDGLWTAALTFLKGVKINEGQGFDLTWMIQNPSFDDTAYTNAWKETINSGSTRGVVGGGNILRYYNCNFDISQTLPYLLPAGAYKLTVDGFDRPGDPMNTAWETYKSGNTQTYANIYLNDNQQLLMNLFDVQSVSSNSLGGEQPSGATFYVPNNSNGASKYIDAGLYPNTLIGVLNDDAKVTIGYRGTYGTSWTAVDNFRLWYIGEVPTIEITVNATEPTPLCLPFALNIDDPLVSQLYAVGSVTDGKAWLYPVASVEAGTPCVAALTETTFRVEQQPVTYKTYVLPWEGGTLVPDADNYTWNYANLKDVKTAGKDLALNILNPENLNFTVNLENLAARKFLSNVTYTGASDASQVAKFNVAPPTRRDIPNAVTIPLPLGRSAAATVTLNDGTTVNVPVDTDVATIYNLIPQQTYTYTVESDGAEVAKGQFTTEGHLRMVYAPSAYNIRDLGGWTTQDGRRTAYGHIFRGSTLNGYVSATAEDLQTLRQLGVGGEIDLRYMESYDKDMGCGTSPFGFTLGVDYYFAAANDWTAANINEAGTQKRLKEEFEFILDHFRAGKAVYYHCAWGADRTGLLTLMLEGILGVELDQIYKDYELTSFSAAPGATNRLKTSFQDRIDVIQSYAGATLRDKFETYFTSKLGVSAEDIAYFRSVMLNSYTLSIDEDAAMPAYYAGTAEVTLHRTLKANMHNTIVLPFELEQATAETLFGEGTKMERITAYDDVLQTEAITTATANVPFLLIPTAVDVNNTYTVDAVTIVETPLTDALFTGGKLVGTYEQTLTVSKSAVSNTDNYVISNDRFYRINADDAVLQNTRAYLVLDTPANGEAKSIVSFSDDLTGIDAIENGTLDIERDGAVYDLQGRRVADNHQSAISNQLPKGIYIVGGKKVIVK